MPKSTRRTTGSSKRHVNQQSSHEHQDEATSSSAFPDYLFMRRPSRPMADKKPLALPAMPNLSDIFGLCSASNHGPQQQQQQEQPFDTPDNEQHQPTPRHSIFFDWKKNSKKNKKDGKKKQKKDDDDDDKPKRNSFLSVMEKLLKSKAGKDIIKKHAKAPKIAPEKKKKSSGSKKNRSSKQRRRMSVSERSATVSMEESFTNTRNGSDVFDWKEYRNSQIQIKRSAVQPVMEHP